jgi:hypothetical protein
MREGGGPAGGERGGHPGRRVPSNLLPYLVDANIPPVPRMISQPVAAFSRTMLWGAALAGAAGPTISRARGGGCGWEKAAADDGPSPNAVDEEGPRELRLREHLWEEGGGFSKELHAQRFLRDTTLYLARHNLLLNCLATARPGALVCCALGLLLVQGRLSGWCLKSEQRLISAQQTRPLLYPLGTTAALSTAYAPYYAVGFE